MGTPTAVTPIHVRLHRHRRADDECGADDFTHPQPRRRRRAALQGYVLTGLAAQPVQPFRAEFTAWISSLTETWPSPLVSIAVHCDTGALPSATLTAMIRSLTVTWPSPLQSPVQLPPPPQAQVVPQSVPLAMSTQPLSHIWSQQKLSMPQTQLLHASVEQPGVVCALQQSLTPQPVQRSWHSLAASDAQVPSQP